LRGGDPNLNTRLQQVRLGQGQTQTSNIAEIVGPDDLHDICASRFIFGPLRPTAKPTASVIPSRRITDGKHRLYLAPPSSGQPR
jgi:hypothetical protein